MLSQIVSECFHGLSNDEERCAEMCDSLIAYCDDKDSQYLTEYRAALGDTKVDEIYNTLKAYIRTHYNAKTVYVGPENGYVVAYVKREGGECNGNERRNYRIL